MPKNKPTAAVGVWSESLQSRLGIVHLLLAPFSLEHHVNMVSSNERLVLNGCQNPLCWAQGD